jgi:hypothetical protein
MKDIFTLQRFSLLWRSYWIERWREMASLLCAGALLNIITCVFFLAAASDTYTIFQYDGQAAWFTLTWFLTGSIFTGLYARSFSSAKASLIFLQLPASHTEKTLLAFCIVAVVFPLVFTLVLSLFNLSFIKLVQSLYVKCDSCRNAYDDFRPFLPFISSELSPRVPSFDAAAAKLQCWVLSIYWCIQGLIFGSFIYFKRYQVLAIIIFACVVFFGALSLDALPSNTPFWQKDAPQLAAYTQEETLLSLLEWLILPAGLWLTAYFHLKERQL